MAGPTPLEELVDQLVFSRSTSIPKALKPPEPKQPKVEYAYWEFDPAGLSARERKLLRRDPLDQAEHWAFVDLASKYRFIFDIGAMKSAIAANLMRYQVGTAHLSFEWYINVMNNGGVEQDHVDRIDKRRLECPGINLIWSDRTQTLADGSHRYVKRYRAGLRTMRIIQVTTANWRPFLLDQSRIEITGETAQAPWAARAMP